MKGIHAIDEARLGIVLDELRLPTIKTFWPRFAEQVDKERWPAARFLSAVAEHDLAEPAHRRIERHLVEAHLPLGKTLNSFAFDAVPMVSKAQVMAITAGDSWLAKAQISCCLAHLEEERAISQLPSVSRRSRTDGAFCSPGRPTSFRSFRLRGMSHNSNPHSQGSTNSICSSSTIWLMSPGTKLKPALFELISARYERRSIMITANQPFGEWNRVFPDPPYPLVAVDWLVRHSTIFEINAESYRRCSAMEAKRLRRRAAACATIKNTSQIVAGGNQKPTTLLKAKFIVIICS